MLQGQTQTAWYAMEEKPWQIPVNIVENFIFDAQNCDGLGVFWGERLVRDGSRSGESYFL